MFSAPEAATERFRQSHPEARWIVAMRFNEQGCCTGAPELSRNVACDVEPLYADLL